MKPNVKEQNLLGPPRPAKMFKLRRLFAKENKLPVYFEGIAVKETAKAVFLYGSATTETTKIGRCCICGRKLTHPVSVELGIGPECGGHYHNWNLIGGYTLENLERLKGAVSEIKVSQWVPKSIVVEQKPTERFISAPLELLTDPKKAPSLPARRVEMETPVKMAIHFPYNEKDLNFVRMIPGREFNPVKKYWTAPYSMEVAMALQDLGFVWTGDMALLKRPKPITDSDLAEIKGLGGSLIPFQKEGVKFIHAKNGRVLLADEMGLGKTIQALAWLQMTRNLPVLIVVPASLKLNWKKEIEAWMSRVSVTVLSGTKPYKFNSHIAIINYDILPYWLPLLSKGKWKTLITDECHYYKNNSAKRTKAVKKIGKNIPYVIAISGTPITNRPIEIFNAIKLVSPNLMPDFWKFAQRYCGARHNGFGWDFGGASNTIELHQILSESIMIRRKKEDVLLDLPEKRRSYVPMSIDNREEYSAAEADFLGYIQNKFGEDKSAKVSAAEELVKIESLKQLAMKGKMEETIAWIRNFLESGEKLVVFAVHKTVINRLMEEFGNIAVKIDGSTPAGSRQKIVEDFQKSDQIRLFVGNIKAAGVGITLTAASNVAILELPWTPGDLTQAEDRCHRIGQKNSLIVHYLLANDTIEERIGNIIEKKQLVLDSVLDGVAEADSESILDLFINSVKS